MIASEQVKVKQKERLVWIAGKLKQFKYETIAGLSARLLADTNADEDTLEKTFENLRKIEAEPIK